MKYKYDFLLQSFQHQCQVNPKNTFARQACMPNNISFNATILVFRREPYSVRSGNIVKIAVIKFKLT